MLPVEQAEQSSRSLSTNGTATRGTAYAHAPLMLCVYLSVRLEERLQSETELLVCTKTIRHYLCKKSDKVTDKGDNTV
jgi:hypothetical protein